MAYQRINFENKPSKKSPISAENLNHMEQGISDAHVSIADIEAYKQIHMNYPSTTIMSKAYVEVEYVADTKEHIKQNYVSKEAHLEHENRIAELEKAIVNS